MADYSKFSDAELTELLRNGNHAAYTEIYRRYWSLLYRNALKMLKDEDEATDIIQEIFTVLWEKAPELTFTSSISSYLYTAVKNRIINLINKNKLRDVYYTSLQEFIEKGTYITDEQLLERELALMIEKEIAALPSKMRVIFELSRKEGLSHEQISRRVDISEGTVKKQIHNAIKILRTRFPFVFF